VIFFDSIQVHADHEFSAEIDVIRRLWAEPFRGRTVGPD